MIPMKNQRQRRRNPRRLIASGKLGPWAEPSPQVWEIEICGHLYVTTVADSGSEVSVEVA
jgi:hypothetical protein